jgi:hypothetical protein
METTIMCSLIYNYSGSPSPFAFPSGIFLLRESPAPQLHGILVNGRTRFLIPELPADFRTPVLFPSIY